ncbi:tail fiber assembly protein [Citrobacter braakii]|uniref:tail fiber assembly protein n=1 Tax=Citrobacter braakii TaxID=57706 RepID=UPI0039908BF4
MKIFFSSEQMGFYVQGASDIPPNSVEISTDIYNKFVGVTWPEGKILGADNSGGPAWVDAPPLTREEELAAADSKKQALIDQANEYMNRKQWPGKAAMGRLRDEEKAQYNTWLDYLDALDAVDTSSAPDIDWPIPPVQ